MNLVHVVPHIDQEASGPSQSVVRLCEELALQGQAVSLHTMAALTPPRGVRLLLHKEWFAQARLGLSLGLVTALRSECATADVLHNHSLWSYPNIAAGVAASKRSAALVTSPRGTLAAMALARSAQKKWFLKPMQWLVIRHAACLHATSAMELQAIRELGLRHPVAVIPNGIDLPPAEVGQSLKRPSQLRRLLFLGRLHPIKGVELLLSAWRGLQEAHPDWELVIAGKGEPAYVMSLLDASQSLKLKRVSFPGPSYGLAKRELYYSADLFVLPTQTENFAMAVAEAQAHALPVVTTVGAPWAGLVEHKSGWWVERTKDEMARALDDAMRMPAATLGEMGARGRAWMVNEYDWTTVASDMATVYRWLSKGGERPMCVNLD